MSYKEIILSMLITIIAGIIIVHYEHSTFDPPIDKPVQTPQNPPIDKPVQTPQNPPIDKPVQTPQNLPIDKPVQTPQNPPIDKPVQTPQNLPIDKPVQTPQNPPIDDKPILNCELSNAALYRADELANQAKPISEQKAMLQEAIRLCPSNAYAHNNFANLLGEEKQFAQAISHYKLALQYKPDLSEAWYGLGEAYYAQKRFPLSLDAYLHACTKYSDAKQRVIKLLENNRYAVTEEGEILDKDSLLMLYDKAKRQTIQNNLAACGLRASPKMTVTFRNFLFDTAKATLQNDETTQLQLTEVAKALKSLLSVAVIQIDGHSDKQAFKDVSLIESNRLNQALSEQRAEKIKTELEHRGVPSHKIRTRGFGDKKPISKHLYKNRRVEIKVD